MNVEDDIDGLAAEYVLGTLDIQERKDVAARRRTDVVLDRAIKAWEMRLGPLNDRIPEVEPPPYVFPSIAHTLWGRSVPSPRAAGATISHRRITALGGCALAACLALAVVWFKELPGIPATLIAQLQRSAAGALLEDGPNIWTPFGFEVSFDFRASTMIVSPVAAGESATLHYQLWLLPRDHGPPISLGLIALPKTTTSPWLATYPPDDLLNTTLAVSLEPEGGSPIGKPSGPLVFVGKLSYAAQ
jgi:anti-sigma-K factor RskA